MKQNLGKINSLVSNLRLAVNKKIASKFIDNPDSIVTDYKKAAQSAFKEDFQRTKSEGVSTFEVKESTPANIRKYSEDIPESNTSPMIAYLRQVLIDKCSP